ncbi:response regulator transcription factor [Aliikangiella coralliicola]|uniref:Response regulator transcription factor n=1 Tax=Aliikangiella coralliicola TaxID=2592383 RepID=A0A545UCA8_9GAMM|nr:response regulator transcription factor [Aliikangiella coralliicola]TQV87097.1 response regulator transcription factor [Aliikangiella coralliicola]
MQITSRKLTRKVEVKLLLLGICLSTAAFWMSFDWVQVGRITIDRASAEQIYFPLLVVICAIFFITTLFMAATFVKNLLVTTPARLLINFSKENQNCKEQPIFYKSHASLKQQQTFQNEIPKNSPGKHVLVIDTNDSNHNLQRILTPYYFITVTYNSQEGLKAIKNFPIDLIIVDLKPTDSDTIQAFQKIKQKSDLFHIPLIAILSDNDEYRDAPITKKISGINTINSLKKSKVSTELILLIDSLQSTNQKKPKGTNSEKELSLTRLDIKYPKTIGLIDDYQVKFLNRVVTTLERHYSETDFTTEKFAALLNVTSRTLQRRLKSLTGHSPKNAINLWRIKKAAGMITEGTETMDNIIGKTGFNSRSNFYRCFKTHIGTSPLKYQENNVSGKQKTEAVDSIEKPLTEH